MIKNKEISSAELTKSVFDRIKAVEGKVDAYPVSYTHLTLPTSIVV